MASQASEFLYATARLAIHLMSDVMHLKVAERVGRVYLQDEKPDV